MTKEDLKELVAVKLDILELMDILDLSMWELVEALDEEIGEHFEELVKACG